MSFYIEWLNCKNTDTEKRYLEWFLRLNPESTKVFYEGTESDIAVAVAIINSVPVERYIEVIDEMQFDEEITSSQVPQFSEFKDGLFRVPELLEFAPEGLSFDELGYQLVKSQTYDAGRKYGENHSKLANIADLVEIHKRPSNVVNTALGKYLLKFLPDEKVDILQRLLLRQCLIQRMIHESAEGILNYRDSVKNLSNETAKRRRNNVRILLEFVLKDSEDEKRLSNINWQVG